MASNGDKDLRRLGRLRAAIDEFVTDAAERDPDSVARALEISIERCKAEGRHSDEEIELAARQLRLELGIRLTRN